MYLWSVSRTERVLSTSFFFTQTINVGFNDWWSGQWSWLSHNETSVHLLSGQTSDQNTNVITGFSVIQSFVESFNTDNLGFKFTSVTIEFDLITNFNFSLFDGTWSDGTSTSNVISAFNWHHEWFINWSWWDWD